MKKILIMALLMAGPGAAFADSASILETPVATAVPTPEKAPASETLAPPWDKVMLKDGQKAEGKIKGYDAFFLEFTAKNALKFHIPWAEVAEVTPAEFSGDTALMRQYLKNSPADVATRIQAKEPSDAALKALWPGFLLHGYGYREAGDSDMFLSLAGFELFGVGVGAFGAVRAADPEASDSDKTISDGMIAAGAGIFVLTWAWDLIGSPFSAQGFNRAHGLSLGLRPLPQGSLATASLSF